LAKKKKLKKDNEAVGEARPLIFPEAARPAAR